MSSMRTDFETAIEELHAHIIAQGKAIQRLEQLMRAHFDVPPNNNLPPFKSDNRPAGQKVAQISR